MGKSIVNMHGHNSIPRHYQPVVIAKSAYKRLGHGHLTTSGLAHAPLTTDELCTILSLGHLSTETHDEISSSLPFDPTAITALPPWALITNTTSGDPRWSYGLSFALSAGTVVLNPNPPTNTNPPTQTGTLTVTISGASASATGAGTGTGTTTGTGTGAGGGVGITTGSPSTTTGAVVTADPLCSAACVRGGPSAAAIGIGAAAGGLLLGALLVALVCLCCLRRRERKAREREETTTYPDLSPRPVGAAAYTSPTPGSSFGNHIRPNRAGVQRPDMYEVQRPYDPFAPSTPSASQHSASLHSRHTGHTGYTGGGVPFPMPHPNEIEPANALHLQTHPPSMIGTGGPPERTPRVSFTTVNVTHHSESSPVIEVDPERTPPGYRRRMI